MMGRMIAVLILVSFVGFPAMANDVDRGSAAFNNGDYQKAMEYWWPLASSGDAGAAFNMGLMYDSGRGVVRDYAAAAKWYRQAANQGLPEAQNNLAFLYSLGRGVPQDNAKALRWYRKAADQGYVAAQFSLGSLYLKGLGGERSDAVAAMWYRKAAERGYAPAQYNLGSMYLGGKGVEKDLSEAVKWYRKAAGQGHVEAKRGLASLTPSDAEAVADTRQPTYALKSDGPRKALGSSEPRVRIQLAAIKSDRKDLATKMAMRLTRSHAPLLDGVEISPVRADLGERGIFYRLRSGPFAEQAAAEALCKKLRDRNQPCMVVNSR